MAGKRALVAGASGVVGGHLLVALRAAGWDVTCFSRGPERPGVISWDPPRAVSGDPAALSPLAQALDGCDLLINLAGASLAEGRLGARHKERVLRSRLDATGALVQAARRCSAPPKVWVNASAVGYYGDTGRADVGEDTPAGHDFLAEVCQRWEQAAAEAEPLGCRVILARIGLVLASDAPAWQRLVLPVRLGLGGRLGSGEQWWSWIDADDVARAILFLEAHPDAAGPFNLTSPDPVQQEDLVHEAALLLGRPAFLPTPAFVLRLALGEVADRLLLSSCKALPLRLQRLGFRWEHPTLEGELTRLLQV